jgi:hypothetical protein
MVGCALAGVSAATIRQINESSSFRSLLTEGFIEAAQL